MEQSSIAPALPEGIGKEVSHWDQSPDGESAMRTYLKLHRHDPDRELYVLHTDRETLEITEQNWLGIRAAG